MHPVALAPSANLRAVKVFRVWLFILLTLMLPLRGVLAQVQPCAGGHAEHSIHALQGHDDTHWPQHDHGHASHDHAAAAPPSLGDDPAQADGSPSKCSACATCCIGTPFASRAAAFAPLLEPAHLKFSSWSAPVPSVVLDALDRPPRIA